MPLTFQSSIRSDQAWLVVLITLLLIFFCQMVQFPLVSPFLLLVLGMYLFLRKKARVKLFLNLGLLLALLVFTAHAIREYTQIPLFYIPVASLGMLTMLLFDDLELSLVMSLAGSVLMGLIMGDTAPSLAMTIIFLMGSLTAAFSVVGARTRGQLIGAGFYAGLIQVVAVFLVYPYEQMTFSAAFLMSYLKPLFINGIISAFVVMATLKIFEYLFGVLTNFSLIELSDFNQPLLRRLIMEAPGTYHHSLVVSNIAETAADQIGANALLTRVGAYYHDIGKMVKPDYFTENQLAGGNRHDDIEPSMSRLVILSHIKEGMELARRYKMNPAILDFIQQHHGTSVMYYFYQKAVAEAREDGEINEDNYRYPGPKPQSKEVAIVHLADSAEAATRALDEPNPQKVEEIVRKVINNKFIDGQLDECHLTLKDIEQIAKSFTRVLSAMYHGRVKYPEQKNGSDSRNRQSSENRPASSSPYPSNGKDDS